MARLLLITLLFSFSLIVFAADFTSTSFIVRDPVISEYGGRGDSTSFQNISGDGQAAIGESSSTNFIVKSGFLYFTDIILPPPLISVPSPIPEGGVEPTGLFDVRFTGISFPFQPVHVLKDGQLTKTGYADAEGKFKIELFGLVTGDYLFSLIGEDVFGLFSLPTFHYVHIEKGTRQFVDDIILSPTLSYDENNIFGQTAPLADASLNFTSTSSKKLVVKKVTANSVGIYNVTFAQLALENDVFRVKSQATLIDGRKSPFSRQLTLDSTKAIVPLPKCPAKGDLNADCRVNLIDLSIMAYWWERLPVPARIDLDGDGKITLKDFSILVYYWTG